ncbi:MAG TPA: PqqD family protein [Gemmatimonadaceae bacterium]
MNIPSEVLAAHLGDEAVLLDLSAKRYYRLNESAAVVFRALEEGEGRDGAIRRLTATFEVTESDAASAVDALLGDFAARGLVARPAA